MSTTTFWDDQDFAPDPQFKFVKRGDTIEGTIVELGKVDIESQRTGLPVTFPQITVMTDDGERFVNITSNNLIETMKKLRPNVGDFIRIRMTNQPARDSFEEKMFQVLHTPAE